MIDKSQFISGVCDIYDERLLQNSLTTEGNVCGILLSDLTLFDDSGFDDKSFVTRHGRMLFRIGKQLRDKGLNNFDEITLLSNINEDVKEKLYNELGNFRQIQNVIDAVSIKNQDVFFDELNKRNILMSLYRKGFNIFEEVALDSGKKVVPFKLFDRLTSSEVLDWYNGQISFLETKINSSKIVEEGYVDFEPEFIDSLENQEQMGVGFDSCIDANGEEFKTFPFMNSHLLGLKHGTISAWAAHSGVGKSSYMITVIMSLISKGERVLLVSNESQIADIKVMFLVWTLTRCLNYWKLSKRRLISGKLTDEDRKKITEAREFFRTHYAKSVKIVTLADADAHLTCQIIKKHILRDGITTWVCDTMKLSTTEGANDAVWLSLVKDTRQMTEICLKYNVIGILTIQLALATQNRAWLDSSCLSNSKAIKETLSNLVMFRKLNPSELDPMSPYFIAPFRSKQKEDGTWYEEPYTPDQTQVFRVAFIDKCRRGIDSGDDGVCYLMRMDGDHCSFFETAKCRPTHKLFITEK